MMFLAINWRVWVVIAALFLYAFVRRMLRNWHHRMRGEPEIRRRPSIARRAGRWAGRRNG